MKPVRCPTCGNTLSVPDEASGKVAKCTCGELIRIPGEHVQAKPPVPGPPATLKRLPPKEGVARPVSPRPKRRNVLLLLVLPRSEAPTSELQSPMYFVCRLL